MLRDFLISISNVIKTVKKSKFIFYDTQVKGKTWRKFSAHECQELLGLQAKSQNPKISRFL